METEKPEVIVGRSTPVEEVDIDLSPDKMVSRKHIILKMEYNMGAAKNEAWIHDQGSSRGTLLNGEPVTDPVKVTRADVIQVGESEVRVNLRKKPKPKKRFQDTDGTPPLRGENDISIQSILAHFLIITVRNILAKYISDFILSSKEFNDLVFTILNNY